MTKVVKLIKEIVVEEVFCDAITHTNYHKWDSDTIMRSPADGMMLRTINPSYTYALPIHTINKGRVDTPTVKVNKESIYYAFSPESEEILSHVGVINKGEIERLKEENVRLEKKTRVLDDSLFELNMVREHYLHKYNHLRGKVNKCSLLGRLKYLFTGRIY